MSDNTDLNLAFPFVSHGGIHEHQVFSPGMTKREYAAIQIMAGFAADPTTADPDRGTIADLAEYAVKWADVLFSELKKESK